MSHKQHNLPPTKRYHFASTGHKTRVKVCERDGHKNKGGSEAKLTPKSITPYC